MCAHWYDIYTYSVEISEFLHLYFKSYKVHKVFLDRMSTITFEIQKLKTWNFACTLLLYVYNLCKNLRSVAITKKKLCHTYGIFGPYGHDNSGNNEARDPKFFSNITITFIYAMLDFQSFSYNRKKVVAKIVSFLTMCTFTVHVHICIRIPTN